MEKYSLKLQQFNSVKLTFIFFAIFILNPLIAILGFVFVIMQEQNSKIKDTLIFVFSCMLAIFVSCINTTKVPENDLVWYLELYRSAGSMDFEDYIFSLTRGKEPLYPAVNYLIYMITGGSERLFIFILSFIMYLLLNTAILRMGKAINLSSSGTVATLILMAFTPYIFVLSAHIIRQFLGASILIYIVVERTFYNKKCLFSVICMSLIHSTTLFFIPLLYFPFFKKNILGKNIIIYLLGALSLMFLPLVLGFMADHIQTTSGVFAYFLDRAIHGTVFEAPPLTLSKLLISTITIMAPFILVYFKKELKQNKGLVFFVNILFILLVFVLANLEQTEVSHRYNFYIWFFFPLAAAIVIKAFNIKAILCGIISTITLLYFFYYLFYLSEWTYKIGEDIFIYTFFNYIPLY